VIRKEKPWMGSGVSADQGLFRPPAPRDERKIPPRGASSPKIFLWPSPTVVKQL